MLYKIIRALWRIKNYDRIPRLPRGMLAGRYESISPEQRRVLARLGARDPAGVQVRLKRAGVETVEELVAQLEHQRPARRLRRRIRLMLGRWVGGTDYHPTQKAILAGARRAKHRADVETEQRLKAAMRAFGEGE